MRPPSFQGFLASYVKNLSRQDTMGLYRLAAEAAASNPRLREPLFLYALMNDKLQVLLNATKDPRLHQEYTQMAALYNKAAMMDALQKRSPDLRPEYQKVYDSYVTIANRFTNERFTKDLMRKKIIQVQGDKGVTTYRLHKDLGINQGNLNAYLKAGNTGKVSLATARRILEYLDSNEPQSQRALQPQFNHHQRGCNTEDVAVKGHPV